MATQIEGEAGQQVLARKKIILVDEWRWPSVSLPPEIRQWRDQ